MKVTPTKLPGVVIVEPTLHGDPRGFFVETFHAARYRAAGIDVDFVQDNMSRSARGTLRGLHLQHPTGQAKLVQVIDGEILDVAVDVRLGSPTFREHVSVPLDSERRRQLFIPVGFAHGFVVKSEFALVSYKCSAFFAPEHAVEIAWNDPALGIDWGVDEPTLSQKDASAPLLEATRDRLPPVAGPT